PEAPAKAKQTEAVRDAGGYRVLSVAGRLYPLQSGPTQIVALNTAPRGQAVAGAKDEAFLKDMHAVLGSRALKTLEAIPSALGLDYVVLDFSLNADGGVELTQAKPGVALIAPDPRAPKDRLYDAWIKATEAVNDLLRSRVSAGH
ncbi:MAG: hypothetical protein ACREKE_03845, partial [bacterium]